MSHDRRSACPINLAVEILGDRWTLLVLRDLMFSDRRHFRALLDGSVEGISPSVLADRLHGLVARGIIRRDGCEEHRQKALFRLTPAGADLLPVIAALGAWAARHCDADPALCGPALELDRGGAEACCAYKERLLAEGAAGYGASGKDAETDLPYA